MSEHRGISAAEKYAELEKAGASRPRCSCHGEEKKWHRDSLKPAGGSWIRCSVKHRLNTSRWREDNPEKSLESVRRWQRDNPEKKREAARRFREANLEKTRESARELARNRRKKEMLLRLLPDRLWMVEQSWPKYVSIARLALGGSTKAERDTAKKKLALILKKEKMEWVNPLIISCAMRTTRLVMSFPLSLESSQEG